MSSRVIVYIDGFNLYYGLREKGWKRYYWLDLQKLSNNLLKPDQTLVKIKYFTARISSGDSNTPTPIRKKMEAKRRRQNCYLEALQTCQKIEIFEGHYLPKVVNCHKCGSFWPHPEEKMTDVNIATQMLTDAFKNEFDTALVVSGDSDIVPPITVILKEFKKKRIIAVFPPERVSVKLKHATTGYLSISEAKLRKSMFPNEIKKPDGYILKRPRRWRRNIRRIP